MPESALHVRELLHADSSASLIAFSRTALVKAAWQELDLIRFVTSPLHCFQPLAIFDTQGSLQTMHVLLDIGPIAAARWDTQPCEVLLKPSADPWLQLRDGFNMLVPKAMPLSKYQRAMILQARGSRMDRSHL